MAMNSNWKTIPGDIPEKDLVRHEGELGIVFQFEFDWHVVQSKSHSMGLNLAQEGRWSIIDG